LWLGTTATSAAVGGLRTAVRDGVSGVLVEGRDPADYAAAIRAVLARRELLSAGARRHADSFSWERTVDSLVAAYTAAAEEMAVAAQRLASPEVACGRLLRPAWALGGVRALGAQVAQ
jgi:D-inositol-3-phosphate glycosyltransferase